jgi:hypothetical protein
MKATLISGLAATCVAVVMVVPVAMAFQQPGEATQQQPAAPASATASASSATTTAGTPASTTVASTTADAAKSNTPVVAAVVDPPKDAADTKKVIRVSKDYIKQLSNYGFYPKNDKGQLVFCKKDAPIGSRFVREHCMDSEQAAMLLERQQQQRDQMLPVACAKGGQICGGAR